MKYIVYNNGIFSLRIKYEKSKVYEINFLKNSEAEIETEDDFSKVIKKQLDEYFAGSRTMFDIDYGIKGTEFQQKVWEAIAKIPYGATKSYREIAEEINSPKAYRAVGLACNKNPVPIIVPCHRVIGSDGKMTGFAGGIKLKEELLRMEKVNE